MLAIIEGQAESGGVTTKSFTIADLSRPCERREVKLAHAA